MGRKVKHKKLKRRQYKNYIRSDAWQEVRSSYRKSKLPQACWCCGVDHVVLHLHHKTYKTLGHEKLNHLCKVCQPCHNEIHLLHRQGGISLWSATKKVRRNVKRYLKRQAEKAAKEAFSEKAVLARRKAKNRAWLQANDPQREVLEV